MGNTILQCFLIVCTGLIVSCNHNTNENDSEKWVNNYVNSKEFVSDSSYLERMTILSADLESLQKFESILDNTKRRDTVLIF